jgi:hypothetical protein
MANKGLIFEWCVYYTIAHNIGLNDENSKKASQVWNTADKKMKLDSANAVRLVESKYGPITHVEKLSGGANKGSVEPKTDLLIRCRRGMLKCSLKYGDSFQLSSAGVSKSVFFLSSVVQDYAKTSGFDISTANKIISSLAKFQEDFGNLGSMPQEKSKEMLEKAKEYEILLQSILGSRSNVKPKESLMNLKYAIIREAMTGEYTFGKNSKLAADHILSENSLQKIDKSLIKKISDKTSVRLALKGRGKIVSKNNIIRLNEIVVRFDTV